MGIVELFIIAVGLSMDAFAVAICKGLSMNKMSYKNAVTAGLFFGGFQALMPLIGYMLGNQFSRYITSFDHWIAFVLLLLIGLNMIKESREKKSECTDQGCGSDGKEDSFSLKNMTVLAIATSIDALAIGVTFAFLKVNIVSAVTFIGIVTFIFSFLGVKIGNVFGAKFESKAELAGGIILVAMGLKILFEHLGFIG
jgi:putative Mn2+ efflux pump MntP